MSDSVQPHRRQPIRLPHPWDSPSKNTGVGCHFLLQCMKVKSESEVTQSCPTLSDPMDSVHGIFQARVLEWGAIAFSVSAARSLKIILMINHFVILRYNLKGVQKLNGHFYYKTHSCLFIYKKKKLSVLVVVQSLSHIWFFAIPWTSACQASLLFTISWSLLKFTSIESVKPSSHLILCCPLLLLPSIFPTIRVFSSNQLFAAGDQSIGASASASVLPMNIQGWFPFWLTGLISLQSKGLSRVFSNTTVWKYQFLSA